MFHLNPKTNNYKIIAWVRISCALPGSLENPSKWALLIFPFWIIGDYNDQQHAIANA